MILLSLPKVKFKVLNIKLLFKTNSSWLETLKVNQAVTKFVDKVDLRENTVLKKMKAEVSRFKKFQLALLGESTNIDVTDKDVNNYKKFILKEGKPSRVRTVVD